MDLLIVPRYLCFYIVLLFVSECSTLSTDDLLSGKFNQPEPLVIVPRSANVQINSQLTFSAVGGSSNYKFDISVGSGALNGNIFTAPSATGTTVVTVTDKRGNRDVAVLTIIPSLGCPTGFILVPANSSVGTNSDFCVAKYEMKCASDTTGAACSLPAISQQANQPWVNIGQATAITACSGLGSRYHLITNSEWMTVARNIENTSVNWSSGTIGSGTLSTGHSDSSPSNTLAASSDTAACFGTGQACSDVTWNSQRRTSTLSNGQVVWDFAGNAKEWINWNLPTGKASPQNAFVEMNTVAVPTVAMPSSSFQSSNLTLTSAANSIGDYYPGLDGSGGAAIRDGDFAFHAGIYSLDLSSSGAAQATLGFRCVYQ